MKSAGRHPNSEGSPSAAARRAPSPSGASPEARVRILYLEDDEVDRRAFLRLVREQGLPYDLTVTPTLREARAKLVCTPFDLIVADYHLPDGHCIELLEVVPETPFVLLTGTLDEQLALCTLERGVDDYLPKDPHQRHLEALPFVVKKALHRKEIHERERQLSLQVREQAELLALAPVFVRDLGDRITLWSAGAQHLYGWSPAEALGRVSHELLHTVFPQPLETIQTTLREQGWWEGELRHLRKEGRPVVVLSRWALHRDLTGRLEAVLEVNTDLTAIKRVEEELARSKEELERLVRQRTARLRETASELEHMSYSMIHDMRAPLRAMQSFAELLEEECAGGLPASGRDYLQRIQEAAHRLDRLITDALNYNTVVRQELPVRPVELGRLLRGLLDTYPNLQPAAAEITLDFQELVVLGNESLLTQCFGNLLGNAVKFVAPGVRPRVRIWAELVDSGELIVDRPAARLQADEASGSPPDSPQPPTPSGSPLSTIHYPLVRVFVQDNGIGIPPEAQEKIFHMFQRMHRESEYPGTGIGLAIVRKAVERMGGRLGLDSAPGKGSKFWVELAGPTAAENRPRSQEAA